MAQHSIIPQFLERLEPILENARRNWLGQPDGERTPTLPVNPQGQIHVGKLLEMMGYDIEKYRQHFRKAELKSPVNAICREQGIKGIAEEGIIASAEVAVRKVIALQGADNNRLAEQLAEAQATIVRQRKRVAELEGQLDLAQTDGVLLRTLPLRNVRRENT